MIQFTLVEGESADILSKKVNALLAERWNLHGYPFSNGETAFFQAMQTDILPTEPLKDVPAIIDESSTKQDAAIEAAAVEEEEPGMTKMDV